MAVGAFAGRGVGGIGNRDGPPGGCAGDVDGLAVRDRHQPRLDVGVGRQLRVGLHGGQERIRPGVIGVGVADYRPNDAQHGGAVRCDQSLKRRLDLLIGLHVGVPVDMRDPPLVVVTSLGRRRLVVKCEKAIPRVHIATIVFSAVPGKDSISRCRAIGRLPL